MRLEIQVVMDSEAFQDQPIEELELIFESACQRVQSILDQNVDSLAPVREAKVQLTDTNGLRAGWLDFTTFNEAGL